jgi:hypothetical protein
MERHRRSTASEWMAIANVFLAAWLAASPLVIEMSAAAAGLALVGGLAVGGLAAANLVRATGGARASPRRALAALVVGHAVVLVPAVAPTGPLAMVSFVAVGTLAAAGAGVNLTEAVDAGALARAAA